MYRREPGTLDPKTRRAGATVLAVEAGKTLIISRQEVRRLAGKYGLVVVGVTQIVSRWIHLPALKKKLHRQNHRHLEKNP